MKQLIVIALGGGVGSVARYVVATGIYAWLGRGFPHGTLFVNVSGSFLMGLLTELLLQRLPLAVEYRAAILVGFLGGYTTFSTFAIETLNLFEEGSLLKAILNVFLSTTLCLAAVWIGLIMGRGLFTTDLYPWWGHDFPYTIWLSVMILMFLLAALCEVIGHAAQLEPVYRGMALLILLGGATIAFSLWAATRLDGEQVAFHGLLSIVAVNAVAGGAVVWLGASAGDWLWQISKSW
ncbi:MAG: fluoride efflux transporter CrcB [Gammaproteobacteria bacterium]